jgi:hypothetical protein
MLQLFAFPQIDSIEQEEERGEILFPLFQQGGT